MTAEDSAVAKSTELQRENDVSKQDSALFHVLRKRYPKVRLITRKLEEMIVIKMNVYVLETRKKCHVVEG
ncbi:MAG: hypothetical protein WAK17_12985 [Candidatus Nitrosopolaris sp.]|jgi:hypothetical protein